MFEKLRSKWKVNGWNLLLIVVTFACGGSLCGFLGRKLLLALSLEKGITWFILYIILITILWPFCVLLISIPLGQFVFFKRYIGKIWVRMSGKRGKSISNLAIFASGAGTNAENIIRHFSGGKVASVRLIVTNKPKAGVVEIARANHIEVIVIEESLALSSPGLVNKLKDAQIDLVVLAGFLLKIPPSILEAFSGRVINIHPALLPGYGGKGMYGASVHEAVLANADAESGISIHYVDEIYDHGHLIFQAKCPVSANDTPESLAQKIHELEYEHYPKMIEEILRKQKSS